MNWSSFLQMQHASNSLTRTAFLGTLEPDVPSKTSKPFVFLSFSVSIGVSNRIITIAPYNAVFPRSSWGEWVEFDQLVKVLAHSPTVISPSLAIKVCEISEESFLALWCTNGGRSTRSIRSDISLENTRRRSQITMHWRRGRNHRC